MSTLTSREYFIEELRKRRAECQRAIKELTDEQVRVAYELDQATNLLEHVEALLRAEQPDDFKAQPVSAVPGYYGYEGLSVKDAVEKLLAEVDRPLHASQVMDMLQKKGVTLSQKDPLATIVTVLVRGVRAGLYRRTAPNTFRRISSE